MEKTSFVLWGLLSIIIAGCNSGINKDRLILAKINNYEITKEEFEEEFKESYFSHNDSLESRKEFLDYLVNCKLILQDAQKKGLDKNKDFLRMIEKFWEQSLLKLSLDKKTKELAGLAVVSDRAIEQVYQEMLKEGKTGESFDQMYTQIKWGIIKRNESQSMDAWTSQLRKDAQVKVDYNLLEKSR